MGEINLSVPRLRKIAGRYFWRPTNAVKALGFVNQALGRDPVEAVNKARKLNDAVFAIRGRDHGPSIIPGSIADVITKYRASKHFQEKLKPKTRKEYGKILDEIERNSGRTMASMITRPWLVQTYEDELVPRGLSIANAHMRIWSIVLGRAYNRGLRADNPALKMELTAPASRKRKWSPVEITTFCVTAVRLDRMSLRWAVLLAWDLAQRENDVIALLWDDWTGDGFKVVQRKTGAKVAVPLHPQFAAELRRYHKVAKPPKDSHVIISEATGKPYKEDYFRHEFSRIRGEAKLDPGLQFRDTRRTGLSEIGDKGGTHDQLRAVGGHADRGALSVYVIPSDAMARAAQKQRHAKTTLPGALKSEGKVAKIAT